MIRIKLFDSGIIFFPELKLYYDYFKYFLSISFIWF
jgi:hypothetical protein